QQGTPQRVERAAVLQRERRGNSGVAGIAVALAAWLMILQKDFADAPIGKTADGDGVRQSGDLDVEGPGRAAVRKALAAGHRDPHFARTVFSERCSALLTLSQRFHATGSINSSIACSTQSRRSLGSIASSSQHRLPYLAANHL